MRVSVQKVHGFQCGIHLLSILKSAMGTGPTIRTDSYPQEKQWCSIKKNCEQCLVLIFL